jgi:putative membrane protein
MQPAFDSLAAGFPQLIFYLVMVAILYIGSVLIYVRLTPHKELELIQSGNIAASIHFSSLVLSLALPVAACLIKKSSLFDVGLWTVFSLLFQLFLFRATDIILFRGMPERIEKDEIAPTLVLASFKLAGSIILAFAISG